MVPKLGRADLNPDLTIDCVTILSLMPSLYTARLHIAGQDHLLIENGTSIRRPSAESIKRVFSNCQVLEYRLVHASAYDEMIGQGTKVENTLEIPA